MSCSSFISNHSKPIKRKCVFKTIRIGYGTLSRVVIQSIFVFLLFWSHQIDCFFPHTIISHFFGQGLWITSSYKKQILDVCQIHLNICLSSNWICIFLRSLKSLVFTPPSMAFTFLLIFQLNLPLCEKEYQKNDGLKVHTLLICIKFRSAGKCYGWRHKNTSRKEGCNEK